MSIPDSFSVGTTGTGVGVPVGVLVGVFVAVLVSVLVGVLVGVMVGVLVGANTSSEATLLVVPVPPLVELTAPVVLV